MIGRTGAALLVGAACCLVAAILVRGADASSSGAGTMDRRPEGVALFRAKGCGGCHIGPGDERAVSTAFPPLTDAPAWAAGRRPGMTAADYLAESIRDPASFISPAFRSSGGPVAAMPDLGLSDIEIAALVSYLLTG